MTRTRSFKRDLAKALRRLRDEDYDAALDHLGAMREAWPGNAQVEILWASLVQLQESPDRSLDDAKVALERAIELDENSPVAPIELGHYLDSIEDDPRAAAKTFAQGVSSARRLLIDGLIGQARALLQLDRGDEALKCVMEAMSLAGKPTDRSSEPAPDVLLRDAAGWLHLVRLKGPFAARIEELLEEVARKRSA